MTGYNHGFLKMSLRGESPWGAVVERYDDGSVKLRIVNKLFNEYTSQQKREILDGFGSGEILPELHQYKQGDEVLCRENEYGLWEPVADGCEGTA
jgi:hypothetical protein